MSCNPEAEAVVLRFLQQYIQLYDGDMREQLLDAYHEDAVMSMSVAYPRNFSQAYPYDNQEVRACNNLKRYLSVGSRNLVCVCHGCVLPQFNPNLATVLSFLHPKLHYTRWLRSEHRYEKNLPHNVTKFFAAEGTETRRQPRPPPPPRPTQNRRLP